jgi:hypothetical protein
MKYSSYPIVLIDSKMSSRRHLREPTLGSELSTVLLEGGPHTLLRLSVELAGSRASAALALTGGLERYLGSVARGSPSVAW